jgi:hypothetical protein
VWLVWTLALTAIFSRVAAVNLANFRPVSNDEVWIMSASYKLAAHGVFGSDLWAGFFNAERHYFIALPVHHILQALVFRIAGADVTQARLVSLVGAVVLVWTVSWLAYRWYGLTPALLAGVLLVFWRSNLTASWPGLPLLAVARSGRYDVSAVAWVWLSILLLDTHLRRPGRATALLLGITSGFATLTQFFGAAVLPLVGLAWIWQRGRGALKGYTIFWLLAGLAVVLLPYALYATLHYPDLVGQTILKGERAHFASPQFYLANGLTEFRRFSSLLGSSAPTWAAPDAFDRPYSPWLTAVAFWPALIFLVARVRRVGAIGDRILFLSIVVLWGFLWLLDQTKAPLYAIVLLPSLCILLAAAWATLLRWAFWPARPALARLLLSGAMVALLIIIVVESRRAHAVDLGQAVQVSSYMEVGRTIDSFLPPGARLLGAERWWWALRDHPYLSMYNVWAQWQVARQSGGPLPEFADWVEESRTDFIIVNSDVRYPPDDLLLDQYSTFLQSCSLPVAAWSDPTYGDIQVYQVAKTSSGALACEP